MRRILILTLLLALAFALRVHLLGNQELRGDEGFTWNYIQSPPAEIVATIIREGDPQPPLHYWLQWGWGELTGYSEFAMRAWSACLSLLLVPLMYQVGRRLFNQPVAFLAAAITAIQPQQIWLAQDVRNMYQLALVALLIATILLHKVKTHPDINQKSRLWLWGGYVLCGAVAMYSHYYALFFLIAHGAYLGFRRDAAVPRLFLEWMLAGLAIGLLVSPWALTILPVYANGVQLNDPGSLSIVTYTASAFGDLLAGPGFYEPLKTVVTLALGAVALVSAAYLLLTESSRSLAAYLLAAILIPFVCIYMITATRATFNSFYFVFAFPAVVLLTAVGVRIVLAILRPIGLGLIAALILTYASALGNHYNNPDFSKTRGMRELAQYLIANTQPDDVFLANAPDPAQVYYIRPTGLTIYMEPGTPDQDIASLDKELEQLLAHRVWFVPARTAQDPNGLAEARLQQKGLLLQELTFGKTRLTLFLSPNEATPVNIRFENGIRLVGYLYLPNEQTTLVWTTDSPIDRDYTAFVKVLAEDGFEIASQDAPPLTPTSQWKPGQYIIDVHNIETPFDQPFAIVAGLYETGQPEVRLKLETESYLQENAALLTKVTISR